MMSSESINLGYISIAGNTKNFVSKLKKYANEIHEQDANAPVINEFEIDEDSPFSSIDKPFFVMVPTYLDGGNGIDNGVKELMTNSFGEWIDFKDNASHLVGVIGSGNRNFNEQYCLTAKRYAHEFDAPFIADYELRGTEEDVKRIYNVLSKSVLTKS